MTDRGKVQAAASHEAHSQPQRIRFVRWRKAKPNLPGRHDDLASDPGQGIANRLPGHRREPTCVRGRTGEGSGKRSEEHTSELQSLRHLVCRLLLEKNEVELSRNSTNVLIVYILVRSRKHTPD